MGGLTFSRGALISTVSPFVVPALTDVAFLADAPFANDFYIVDRNGTIGENAGRIVRVDASGEARQYLTPVPVPGDLVGQAAAVSLANVEDVAIDELTGIVYWVSGGEIWRASMPVDGTTAPPYGPDKSSSRRRYRFLKNSALTSVNDAHCSGRSSSKKMASTGQTSAQTPQSMHSSGLMKY
jgi:hypothetical protein